MSEILADYHRKRDAAKRAALLSVSCDLETDVTSPSVARARVADNQFAIAARLYVRAIDALPIERKREIRGWIERAPVNSGEVA